MVLKKLKSNKESTFGVVFDIDGVLMKDGFSIQNASNAIDLLKNKETNQAKYPFVFVTNNGGFTEKEKADKISKVLDYKIEEDRVMVAHTPIKSLIHKYKDGDVLLIAKDHQNSKKLGEWYGFKNYLTLQQYIEQRPYLCPAKYSTFWTTGVKSDYVIKERENELPIKSIILLEEPKDWGECIQVITDILQTKDGLINKNNFKKSKNQKIDLIVTNPDLVNASEFSIPRFAMGSLLECIKLLYKNQTGRELKYELIGKPYPITYQYAKELIANQLKKLGQSKPKHIYAIGDNPYSDIKGANNLENEGWISILVKTGCYKGEGNHPEIPAKYVCDNVYDAINLILKLENKR